MSQPPFEELDHTADLALRVRGPDLASLFRHAAQGMFHLMQPEAAPEAQPVSHAITIRAYDIEMLLVDWLEELLYLAHRDAAHFEHLDIHELCATLLRAEVHGRRPVRFHRHIKAVTYADLAIRRVGSGYETIVTFDV